MTTWSWCRLYLARRVYCLDLDDGTEAYTLHCCKARQMCACMRCIKWHDRPTIVAVSWLSSVGRPACMPAPAEYISHSWPHVRIPLHLDNALLALDRRRLPDIGLAPNAISTRTENGRVSRLQPRYSNPSGFFCDLNRCNRTFLRH